jgi:hypothetical protein
MLGSTKVTRSVVALGAVALLAAGCNAMTTPATNVGTSSATLNGTVSYENGDGPGQYWWEYSRDDGATWTQTATNSFGVASCSDPSGTCTQNISQNVTGLQSSTKYMFRLAGWTTVNGQQTPVTYADSKGTTGPPYTYSWFYTQPVPQPDIPPGAWNLTWSDEFNGTSVDTNNNWELGWFGVDSTSDSPSSFCYTTDQVNEPGDGYLHLGLANGPVTCRGTSRQYKAGQVETWLPSESSGKFDFQYGAVEARIYLPGVVDRHGNDQIANWPAFWTIGKDCTNACQDNHQETDVVEGLSGGAAFHVQDWDANGKVISNYGGTAKGSFADGWHTFDAVWTPSSVTWYYDGQQFGTVNVQMSQMEGIVLGNGPPQCCGGPLLVPADMRVDYVRVWSPAS